MIQEPITDLKRILDEPVDEVTAEHRAIFDIPTGNVRGDRQETAGRVPTLRSRLTVRLVALEHTQPESKPVIASGPYTPAPGYNDPTPAPEGYDDDEYDEEWGDASSYWETPPPLYPDLPQTGKLGNPYTPIPNNDLWLNQYRIELPAWGTRSSNDVLPILLPTLPEIVEADVVPSRPARSVGLRYFDPTLAMLTILLLLGILGGIGFGYLLTLVNQG